MSAADITSAIKAALPDAHVRLTDLAGLSRVKQHQLVYAAFGGRMGGDLHALQLTTSATTPEAAAPDAVA